MVAIAENTVIVAHIVTGERNSLKLKEKKNSNKEVETFL